jgi:hypothetical protein
LLDYVWFSHGAAVPAILYDHTVRRLDSVSPPASRLLGQRQRRQKHRSQNRKDGNDDQHLDQSEDWPSIGPASLHVFGLQAVFYNPR